MKGVSEFLSGRIGLLTLLGFSLRERFGVTDDTPFLPTDEYFSKQKKTTGGCFMRLMSAPILSGTVALHPCRLQHRLFTETILEQCHQKNSQDPNIITYRGSDFFPRKITAQFKLFIISFSNIYYIFLFTFNTFINASCSTLETLIPACSAS